MRFIQIRKLALVITTSLTLGVFCVRTMAVDYSALIAAAARIEVGQSQQPFQKFEALRVAATNSVARKDLERALAELLHSDSSYLAKKFACQELGIIGTDFSVPALAPLLLSDPTVGIACLALTTYPAGQADAALRKAATSTTGLVKVQLIQTLGDRPDSKALKLIVSAANDPDPRVAETAISALGKQGSPRAARELTRLARNPTVARQAVREAMLTLAQKLSMKGERRTATRLYQSLIAPQLEIAVRRAALEGLTRLERDGGQARILRILKSDDRSLRSTAIAAVGRLKTPSSSAPFAALFPELSQEEQAWMIESISAIGDAPALACAADSLTSDSPTVRQAAIVAFAKLAGQDSVPMLVSVLEAAKSPDDARQVEAALVSLPSGGSADRRIAIALEAAKGSVRAQVLTVMMRRQGAAITPVLLTEADNPSPVVAKTAFRALTKTADAKDVPVVISKLLRPLDPEVRPEAEATVAALLARVKQASLRTHAVRDALARADTPEKKISLLTLFPACGDETAFEALGEFLADPNPAVATSALEALTEWSTTEAWTPLAEIYLKPGDETRRTIALKGLVRLLSESNAKADEQDVGRYAKLLEAARSDIDRRQLLGALGGSTHPAALTLSKRMVSNQNVQAEAIAAVRRIAAAIKSSHPQEAEAALRDLPGK
jgi:HEAT repeat protein